MGWQVHSVVWAPRAQVKPATAQNFVRLSLAGRCKTRAVGRKDGLCVLPWEKSLLPEGCGDADCGLPSSLFGPWELVRQSALEAIRTADGFEGMFETVRSKGKIFGLMDDCWELEEKSLVALLGSYGRDRS